MMELKVDPARLGMPETGFYVRATLDGKWGSHDIAHLGRGSLIMWLKTGQAANENFTINVLLPLLGLEQVGEEDV
jgi:hypothetical protein